MIRCDCHTLQVEMAALGQRGSEFPVHSFETPRSDCKTKVKVLRQKCANSGLCMWPLGVTPWRQQRSGLLRVHRYHAAAASPEENVRKKYRGCRGLRGTAASQTQSQSHGDQEGKGNQSHRLTAYLYNITLDASHEDFSEQLPSLEYAKKQVCLLGGLAPHR